METDVGPQRSKTSAGAQILVFKEEAIESVKAQRIIHGILNALWKICSLVVNGQSFLVIDGYLLNLF
jgi:hypothetical protein